MPTETKPLHEQILERAKEGWLSADEIKKQRTAARKTKTSLDKQLNEMKKYLSPEACEEIRNASRMLERFGDALEVAGRRKRQMEEAEALRIKARKMECKQILRDKFDGSLEDRLWYVWAVSPHNYDCQADAILRTISDDWSSLTSDINGSFESELDVYSVVRDEKPVKELLDAAIPKIEAKIAELKLTSKLAFMQQTVIPALVAEKLRAANKNAVKQ